MRGAGRMEMLTRETKKKAMLHVDMNAGKNAVLRDSRFFWSPANKKSLKKRSAPPSLAAFFRLHVNKK